MLRISSVFLKLLVLQGCLLLRLFCTAQATTNWYSVKAFLPNWNGCAATLTVEGQTVNTDTVRQDMYSFVDTATGVHEALFQIKKGSVVVALPLFIEPGTIKIVDKGYRRLTATGSTTNDAYQKLLNQITQSALLRYGYYYDQVNEYKAKLCTDYIKQHRSSVLSLHLLKYYPFLRNPNDTLYTLLFNQLDSSLKTTYLGAQMSNSKRLDTVTAVGKTVPNLQLPDTLRQLSSLYEKGKYTLIDFWASWCVPCRLQSAALVKLYKAFQPKGFTIVSVSLDKEKALWLNAIKHDRLTWKQLSELKGWDGMAVKTFHISAVPTNLLLDENGIIIAKNLRLETLNDKLSQLLP